MTEGYEAILFDVADGVSFLEKREPNWTVRPSVDLPEWPE
jgi:hypothetical protein